MILSDHCDFKFLRQDYSYQSRTTPSCAWQRALLIICRDSVLGLTCYPCMFALQRHQPFLEVLAQSTLCMRISWQATMSIMKTHPACGSACTTQPTPVTFGRGQLCAGHRQARTRTCFQLQPLRSCSGSRCFVLQHIGSIHRAAKAPELLPQVVHGLGEVHLHTHEHAMSHASQRAIVRRFEKACDYRRCTKSPGRNDDRQAAISSKVCDQQSKLPSSFMSECLTCVASLSYHPFSKPVDCG